LHGHDDSGKAAADDGDVEAIGDSRLLTDPFDQERKLPERRLLTARFELEVAHLLPGRHVHEAAQLGFGRLRQRARARVLFQPRYGFLDEPFALTLVEL
jgi:hypothetical protein